MSGETGEMENKRVPHARRWPTGWLALSGLALGALAGQMAGALPVGAAAGVALGIGLDSLLNDWLNDMRYPQRDEG
ncbi:MAG: hypothetical protein ACUVSU_12330 [Aggregatilineaceae bacterium]